MSQDIRNFFSRTPTGKSLQVTSKPVVDKKKSKKRRLIESDDSDDDISSTKSKRNKAPEKDIKPQIKSDKSSDTSKYFEVDKSTVKKMFGNSPVKRVRQPKVSRKASKKEFEDDEIFNHAVMDLDEDEEFIKTCLSQSSGNQSQDQLEKSLVSIPPSKSRKNSVILSSPERTPTKRKARSPLKSPSTPSPVKKLEHYFSPKKGDAKKQEDHFSPKKGDAKKQEDHFSPKKGDAKKQEYHFSPKKGDAKKQEDHFSPKEDDAKKRKIENKAPKKVDKIKIKEDSEDSDTFETTVVKTGSKKQNREAKASHSPNKKLSIPGSERKTEKEVWAKVDREPVAVSELWVDKYRPTSIKNIIGQQGDKSVVNKLLRWLRDWHSNRDPSKKHVKPSPWAKDDSGAYFKAALLSGPPGIGKTTTVHLVCKELGIDMVEFNASDTRSKKLLNQEVGELLSSKSLSPFFQGSSEVSLKRVLVMDEVDGMAGNEDRGGVQELMQLIKNSKVPVVCMCNDRNHPKIRSLANYCFDLRVNRPRVEQIKGAMMSVCFKEKLKVKPEVLVDIINNTNQDIRLILNHLSMLAAASNQVMKASIKDMKIGPWDVLRKVFSEEEHKRMSIHDKSDLFFYDYSIAPLFVQENYLNVVPHSSEAKTKLGKMRLFAKAAESLSAGDLIDRAIRSKNAWSLLPTQAMFSSVMPGDILEGHMGGQINFPLWLGKNSRKNKTDRLTQEIQAHTRLRLSGSKEDIVLDYSRALLKHIVTPLAQNENAEESISVMHEYSLLREDLDSLAEISSWNQGDDPFSKLSPKVKAAFTRAYNKNPVISVFASAPTIKKKKRGGGDMWGSEDEEEEEDSPVDSQDITTDALIMKKSDKKSQKTSDGAGASKGRGAVRKPVASRKPKK